MPNDTEKTADLSLKEQATLIWKELSQRNIAGLAKKFDKFIGDKRTYIQDGRICKIDYEQLWDAETGIRPWLIIDNANEQSPGETFPALIKSIHQVRAKVEESIHRNIPHLVDVQFAHREQELIDKITQGNKERWNLEKKTFYKLYPEKSTFRYSGHRYRDAKKERKEVLDGIAAIAEASDLKANPIVGVSSELSDHFNTRNKHVRKILQLRKLQKEVTANTPSGLEVFLKGLKTSKDDIHDFLEAVDLAKEYADKNSQLVGIKEEISKELLEYQDTVEGGRFIPRPTTISFDSSSEAQVSFRDFRQPSVKEIYDHAPTIPRSDNHQSTISKATEKLLEKTLRENGVISKDTTLSDWLKASKQTLVPSSALDVKPEIPEKIEMPKEAGIRTFSGFLEHCKQNGFFIDIEFGNDLLSITRRANSDMAFVEEAIRTKGNSIPGIDRKEAEKRFNNTCKEIEKNTQIKKGESFSEFYERVSKELTKKYDHATSRASHATTHQNELLQKRKETRSCQGTDPRSLIQDKRGYQKRTIDREIYRSFLNDLAGNLGVKYTEEIRRKLKNHKGNADINAAIIDLNEILRKKIQENQKLGKPLIQGIWLDKPLLTILAEVKNKFSDYHDHSNLFTNPRDYKYVNYVVFQQTGVRLLHEPFPEELPVNLRVTQDNLPQPVTKDKNTITFGKKAVTLLTKEEIQILKEAIIAKSKKSMPYPVKTLTRKEINFILSSKKPKEISTEDEFQKALEESSKLVLQIGIQIGAQFAIQKLAEIPRNLFNYYESSLLEKKELLPESFEYHFSKSIVIGTTEVINEAAKHPNEIRKLADYDDKTPVYIALAVAAMAIIYDSIKQTKKETQNALKNNAHMAYANQDYDLALSKLNEYLASEPNDALALHFLFNLKCLNHLKKKNLRQLLNFALNN